MKYLKTGLKVLGVLTVMACSSIPLAAPAHAATYPWKCESTSWASGKGRDARVTLRNPENSKQFARLTFVAEGEHMYAINRTKFNIVEYRAYFEGTGKTWYWNLTPGKNAHDNLDLPEGHKTQINVVPTVKMAGNCANAGGRT